MTEGTPPRNGRNGVIGAVTDLGRQLMGALPPAFIALLVVNVLFIGVVLWFEHTQSAARAELVGKLVDACVGVIEHQSREP